MIWCGGLSLFFPTNATALSLPAKCSSGVQATSLRPLRPWIRRLLDNEPRHSPTLRRLMRLADRHNLIIHVNETEADAGWDGRIQFAGVAAGYRFLRIDLKRLPDASAAAILSHELQHAVEIANAQVETVHAFNTLFRTIGFPVPWGPPGRYDTAAAIEAGLATWHELTSHGTQPAWRSERGHPARWTLPDQAECDPTPARPAS